MNWLVEGVFRRGTVYALTGDDDACEEVARSLVSALKVGKWCGRKVLGKRAISIGMKIVGARVVTRSEARNPAFHHVVRNVMRTMQVDLVIDFAGVGWPMGDPCIIGTNNGDAVVKCTVEDDEICLTQMGSWGDVYWGALRIVR